jgi:PAS domain S-box-containing protein
MQSGRGKSLLQYGVAVLAVAAAFVVRLALGRSFGDAVAFSMLCGAVSFVVWFGGYRPALLCVGLAFFAALLVEVRDGAFVGGTGRMLTVGLYLLSCIIIIVFGEIAHIARRRLEAARADERRTYQESQAALQESEEKYRSMVETANEGIWRLDADGRITFVNQRMAEMLGYSVNDMVGRTLWDFTFEEDQARANQLFNRRRAGISEHVDVRFRHCDGGSVWTLMGARPIQDAEEQFQGALDLFMDVTERRQAAEALRRQSERLRLLWESATVLLTTEDPEAMLRSLFARIAPHLELDVYFNYLVSEDGEQLCLASCAGIPEEEQRKISRLDFGQAICGNVALRRQPIVATGIQESGEPMVQLVKSYGIRAYACNPLLVEDRLLGTLSFASRRRDQFDAEELDFLATVCRYVTVAYERLRLVRELKAEDQRKDEFLATLAHELRNPLAPLRNALEILQRPGVDADLLQRSRQMMQRQVQHLIRLVDDLLDVSRAMRGKITLHRERVELASIVARGVEAAQALIAAQEHRLSIQLSSESLILDADPVRLAQVVANLLTNAAKYTERGGHIAIAAEREAQGAQANGCTAPDDKHSAHVLLRVTDSGIGIAPEMLCRVFDLFVQVDHATTKSQGGLGIGLTLVRNLVEMHQGTVVARSAGLGMGTEFVVRLPLAAGQVTEPRPPARSGIDKHDPPAAPLRRIVVVDDNIDAAESLAMLLRLQGHEVSVAHDGAAALQLTTSTQPELVFLDIGMPGMDGNEVARRLRQHPQLTGLVLVAVTGWGAPEDRRRTAEAGFDHHLVKPVEPRAIHALLAAMLPRTAIASEDAKNVPLSPCSQGERGRGEGVFSPVQ